MIKINAYTNIRLTACTELTISILRYLPAFRCATVLQTPNALKYMKTPTAKPLQSHLAPLASKAASNNAWPKLVIETSQEPPANLIYSYENSHIGKLLLVSSEGKLCYLGLATDDALELLQQRWPKAIFKKERANHAKIAKAIDDKAALPSINIMLFGRPLQLAVWQQLANIKSGQLCTYTDIATAIGRPKAVRAVASCVGQNPITYLLPCHRVIAKSGKLGGYYWGLDIKQKLLASEL